MSNFTYFILHHSNIKKMFDSFSFSFSLLLNVLSKKKWKALLYTNLVIIFSMLQLLVDYLTAFWFGNQNLSISGKPIKISLYLLSFLFVSMFIVQTTILTMTIKPVLQHIRTLDKIKSEISNVQSINVLKRSFLKSLSFVLSDVFWSFQVCFLLALFLATSFHFDKHEHKLCILVVTAWNLT